MTDPYPYECQVTVNENSRFPDVEFHKIIDSDDALQHQIIIIRELKAKNEKLEDEKQELLKQIAELQQTCKENKMDNIKDINLYEILTNPDIKPETVKAIMIPIIKDRIQKTENYLENLKRDLETLEKK